MKRARLTAALATLALAFGTALLPAAQAQTAASTPTAQENTLRFAGTDYIYRRTEGAQHDYTPAGQEDLQKWRQMVSVLPEPGIDEQHRFSWAIAIAMDTPKNQNELLYSGQLAPGEYTFHLLLATEGALELALIRPTPYQGGSLAITVQQRFHGEDIAQAESWLQQNTPRLHADLQRWQPPARLP